MMVVMGPAWQEFETPSTASNISQHNPATAVGKGIASDLLHNVSARQDCDNLAGLYLSSEAGDMFRAPKCERQTQQPALQE
jgi:hypothetical protein